MKAIGELFIFFITVLIVILGSSLFSIGNGAEISGTGNGNGPVLDVSGQYQFSQGIMTLRQNGASVQGSYNWSGGGTQTGTLQGNILYAQWADKIGSGDSKFVFAPDGSSFEYYWRFNGETEWRDNGLEPRMGNPKNEKKEIFVRTAFSEYIQDKNDQPGILVRLGTWKHGTNQDELVRGTTIYVKAFWEGDTNPIKDGQITTDDNGYAFFSWIFSKDEFDKHGMISFSPSSEPYDPNAAWVDVNTYIPEDLSHFTPESEILNSYPNEVPSELNTVSISPPNQGTSTLKSGSVWNEQETGPLGNYNGIWTVRDDGKTIDASWSGGHIVDIIDVKSIQGTQITLYRHGNKGTYTGTISMDGLSMSGTASWYTPGDKWTASTNPP